MNKQSNLINNNQKRKHWPKQWIKNNLKKMKVNSNSRQDKFVKRHSETFSV